MDTSMERGVWGFWLGSWSWSFLPSSSERCARVCGTKFFVGVVFDMQGRSKFGLGGRRSFAPLPELNRVSKRTCYDLLLSCFRHWIRLRWRSDRIMEHYSL